MMLALAAPHDTAPPPSIVFGLKSALSAQTESGVPQLSAPATLLLQQWAARLHRNARKPGELQSPGDRAMLVKSEHGCGPAGEGTVAVGTSVPSHIESAVTSVMTSAIATTMTPFILTIISAPR